MAAEEKSGVFAKSEDNIKYLRSKLANITKNSQEILIYHDKLRNDLSYVVYDLRRVVEIFSTPDEINRGGNLQ